MTYRRRCAWSAAIAAGLGLSAQAGAYQTGLSLGLNFGCDRGGGGPSPTSSDIPAGGFAGVPTAAQPAGLPGVDQTNWNNLHDASLNSGVGIFNGATLDRNNVAEASPINVSWKGNGSSDPTSNNHFESMTLQPPAPQNFELYQGYLDTDDNTTTRVNVRNLPAADFAGGYDLYVYFLGSSSARGGTYGVSVPFTPPPDDPNAIPTSTLQPNRRFNNQAGSWVSDPDLGDIFVPSGSAANGPDLHEDPGTDFSDIGNFGVFRGLTALDITMFATVIGDRTFGFGDRERAPVSAVELVTGPQWNVDGGGDWNTAGNWSGGIPNAVNAHARLFSKITTGPKTVSINSPVTVGVITFNNANSYVVSGSGPLTLDVTGGPAVLNVVAGSHSINAPLTFLDNTQVNVTAGSLTVSQLQPSTVNLDKQGTGVLTVNNLRMGNVTVSGGKLQIAPNGTAAGVSRIGALAINPGAALDLTNNKLITTTPVGSAGSTNTYTGVSGLIQSGRNGGGWSGSGIVTSQSTATTGSLTSIGVATAQQVKGLVNPTDTAVFAGQTVTGSDTLVMFTYGGDANLDGKINVDDYGRIDSSIPLGIAGWYNGDFNYDGKINVDDYGIIDSNIGIQGAPFSTEGGTGGVTSVTLSSVPEPAVALAIPALGSFLACPRRRRRR